MHPASLVILLLLCPAFAMSQSPQAESYRLSLSPQKEYQTIVGFGASDAWRCEYVGKNWPLAKKEAIADLLFSKDATSAGAPKGIGLSIWRFYIGSGSAEQEEKSGIADVDRRAQCFQNADGSYDWSKQAGQQWFLQAAKKRNVEKMLAFIIAPPVHISANQKAYPSPKDSQMNILPGKMAAYAKFLVDVLAYFNRQGIPFDYISPVNEPQWDWSKGTQEGAGASNQEIYELTRELSKELVAQHLSTRIVVSEAGQLQHLYQGKGKAENQLAAFWAQGSPVSIRDIPQVEKVISGHSYFTTWPFDKLISVRKHLAEHLSATPAAPSFWQTEFCILEHGINDHGIHAGRKRDTGINTALYYARVIHADLVEANAASWQFWTALTDADFKDGLIYLDRGVDDSGRVLLNRDRLHEDGFFRASKTLWALGNFSRFIRPGMKRIEASYTLPTQTAVADSNFLVSAYKDDKNKLVIVAINYAETERTLQLPAQEFTFPGSRGFEIYTTSSKESLSKSNKRSHTLTIEPRSVVTIVGCLK